MIKRSDTDGKRTQLMKATQNVLKEAIVRAMLEPALTIIGTPNRQQNVNNNRYN